MKLKIRINTKWTSEVKDRSCSTFICLYFLLDNVNSVVQDVFRISGNQLMSIKLFIAGSLLFFMLRPLIHFNNHEWKLFIVSELIGLAAYFYSYILGVKFSVFSEWAGTTLVVCIPLCVFCMVIQDKGILYRMLVKVSYFIFMLLLLDMQGNMTGKRYDLHFSYALLLVIILHFSELISGKSKLFFITIVSGIIMIVLFGSRGTLICLAVYLILKILTNISNKKRRYMYIVLLVVAFGVLYWITNNVMVIYNFFKELGYTSRTLDLFAQGSFLSHDSGRSGLWEAVWNAINSKMWFGWGIRGAIDEMLGHPYPHQFFMDLWLTFGVPIGTVIIILLLLPVKRVIIEKKGIDKDLYQIFFSLGFVSLMYSNSLFISQYYFVFLGLILSNRFKQSRSRKYEI